MCQINDFSAIPFPSLLHGFMDMWHVSWMSALAIRSYLNETNLKRGGQRHAYKACGWTILIEPIVVLSRVRRWLVAAWSNSHGGWLKERGLWLIHWWWCFEKYNFMENLVFLIKRNWCLSRRKQKHHTRHHNQLGRKGGRVCIKHPLLLVYMITEGDDVKAFCKMNV